MSSDVERTGRCNCGAVRFRTRGELRHIIYCHCSQCRRQTGHFYAATNVETDSLILEGGESLSWYRASSGASRGFCKICGCALFWQRDASPTISVLAGAFDTPTGLKGGIHIFTSEKGDYYEIDDGLPQHPET